MTLFKSFYLLVSLLLVLVLFSCSTKKEEVLIEKPNVLFIAVDDLNDWIEPLGGHPQSITPNLSRLANEAVLFENNYCTSPACNPSRTALMTGIAPHNSGMYVNMQVWREVLPDAITIPQYFTSKGYWSAGAGKIFHNNQPDSQSWQEYYPSLKKHMPSYYSPKGEDNLPIGVPKTKGIYGAFDWSPIDKTDEETGDYQSVEWIMEKLKQKHDKPFFLACGIYRPHLPWYVPQKYFDMHPLDKIQLPKVLENDLDDIPKGGRYLQERQYKYHKLVLEKNVWKESVQGYLASITYSDAMVGKLLDALEASPYVKNTIVVLWSDHGWQLGEKKHWRKFHVWNNVLRTVCMIKVPKGITGLPEGTRAASRVDASTSLIDLFPTLTELCGLPPKNNFDGHSLVPLLKDPKAEWKHAAISSSSRIDLSVFKNGFRYIKYINDGGEELYNHKEDPDEWYNLAADPEYSGVMSRMRKLLPENPAPVFESDYRTSPKK